MGASPRGIISAIGPTEARPRCRTSPSSVASITAPCTRRATRSRVYPTGLSSSGGRTVTRCLRCRRLLQCQRIPSRRSARVTLRKAFASTRGRGVRAGLESDSMWGGRSTSCTLSPRDHDPVRQPSRDRRPFGDYPRSRAPADSRVGARRSAHHATRFSRSAVLSGPGSLAMRDSMEDITRS